MRVVRCWIVFLGVLATTLANSAPLRAQGWTAVSKFGEGQMSIPTSVAFAANGDYWVADPRAYKILRFTPVGTLVSQLGSQGTGPGKFGEPWGICTDLAGNLYVSDLLNDVVQKFDSAGNYLRTFSESGRFARPRGLAVDVHGNLYVACENTDRVEKFDADGNFVLSFGSTGASNGQFRGPWGVAVANNGDVVVSDYHNRRIQRFTSSGNFIWSAPTKNNEVAEGVSAAWDGRIIVSAHSLAYPDFLTQTGTSNLQVFGPTGNWKETLGAQGSGLGQLNVPVLTAIAPNGDLLVSEHNGKRVSVWKRTRGSIVLWGNLSEGRSDIPTGLQDIVQFDMAAHVVALRGDGTVLAWGNNSAGQATVPTGLANVVQVQAGDGWTLALKADGTIVGWGNFYGADNPFFYPQLDQAGLMRRLGDGYADAFAIRADGKTVWWGIHASGAGKTTIFSGDPYVEIGAGIWHGMGLRANGTVGTWSLNPSLSNAFGQLSSVTTYQNVVDLAGGHSTSVFLFKNGTVHAQGYGGDNRLSGFSALSNGVMLSVSTHSAHMILKDSSGSLIGFGNTSSGQLQFPSISGNILQLANSGNASGALVAPTDPTAPTSTLTVSPTTPTTGWHKSDVTVNLAATDNSGGAGVKEIRYTVDMGAEQVIAGASGSFTVSSEGVHTIAYWAVDNSANVESTNFATVKIDKTAPSVAHNLTAGTLTLTPADSLSGVLWAKFKIDNGAEQTYSGPVAIPANARTVSFRASDNAGNVSASQTIATGPLLASVEFTSKSPAYAGSTVGLKVNLLAPAPSGGLVVSLTSSDPAVLPLPATITVPAGSLFATATIVLGPVPTDTMVRATATVAGSSMVRNLGVLVPVPKSLAATPSVAVGGSSLSFKLTLVSKAPAGGQVVQLTSLDPAVIVPASVVVPVGQTTKTFTATSSPVSSDRAVLVSATADSEAVVCAVSLRAITVLSAAFTPPSVVGGAISNLRVVLSRPAPTGGTTVSLSAAGAGATVPATLNVPGGATSATVAVSTVPVSVESAVLARASFGTTSVRATLTIAPAKLSALTLVPSAVSGGTSATGVVQLTGSAPAGGWTVQLAVPAGSPANVPASVVVPAGATQAAFTIGTSSVTATTPVLITARLGLDAKTATLTVKP